MKRKNKWIIASCSLGSIASLTTITMTTIYQYNKNKVSIISIYDENNNFICNLNVKSGTSWKNIIDSKILENNELIKSHLISDKKIDYFNSIYKENSNYINDNDTFVGKNKIILNFVEKNEIFVRLNLAFNLPNLTKINKNINEAYLKNLLQSIKNSFYSLSSRKIKIVSEINKEESKIYLRILNLKINKNDLPFYKKMDSEFIKLEDLFEKLNISDVITADSDEQIKADYSKFVLSSNSNNSNDYLRNKQKEISFKEFYNFEFEYDLAKTIFINKIEDNKEVNQANIQNATLISQKDYSFKDLEKFKNKFLNWDFNNYINGINNSNLPRDFYFYDKTSNKLINLNSYYLENNSTVFETFWNETNDFKKFELFTNNSSSIKKIIIKDKIDEKEKIYYFEKTPNNIEEIFKLIKNKYYFNSMLNKAEFYKESDIDKFKSDYSNWMEFDKTIEFIKTSHLMNFDSIKIVNKLDINEYINTNNISLDIDNFVNSDFNSQKETLNKTFTNDLINKLFNKNNLFWTIDSWSINIDNFSELKIYTHKNLDLNFTINKLDSSNNVINSETKNMQISAENNLIINNEFIFGLLEKNNNKYDRNRLIGEKQNFNSIYFRYKKENEDDSKYRTEDNEHIEIKGFEYTNNATIENIVVTIANNIQSFKVLDSDNKEYYIHLPIFKEQNNTSNDKINDGFLSITNKNKLQNLLNRTPYIKYKFNELTNFDLIQTNFINIFNNNLGKQNISEVLENKIIIKDNLEITKLSLEIDLINKKIQISDPIQWNNLNKFFNDYSTTDNWKLKKDESTYNDLVNLYYIEKIKTKLLELNNKELKESDITNFNLESNDSKYQEFCVIDKKIIIWNDNSDTKFEISTINETNKTTEIEKIIVYISINKIKLKNKKDELINDENLIRTLLGDFINTSIEENNSIINKNIKIDFVTFCKSKD